MLEAVKETLNALLDAGADHLCKARYDPSEDWATISAR